MDSRYLKYKLMWWVREHSFLLPQLTYAQKALNYTMPECYGDWAVHPCVRYVKKGIGGYQWWMALSPYPQYDTSKENILLFRAADMGEGIPDNWEFVKEVQGSHPKGYNSDPNLYYDDISGELWVIWREWETENVPKESPFCCSFACKTTDGVNFSAPRIIAMNQTDIFDNPSDTQMCPTVISYKNKVWLYGSHYSYEPRLLPMGLCRYVERDDFFILSDSVPWNDKSFDLWHFDMFEVDGILYQIVTGRSGNAIYLGKSCDGIDFTYSRRPLYSYRWFFRKNYFYKPSAVVKDDKIYLFFPRKMKGSVRIVVREMLVADLNKFFK